MENQRSNNMETPEEKKYWDDLINNHVFTYHFEVGITHDDGSTETTLNTNKLSEAYTELRKNPAKNKPFIDLWINNTPYFKLSTKRRKLISSLFSNSNKSLDHKLLWDATLFEDDREELMEDLYKEWELIESNLV